MPRTLAESCSKWRSPAAVSLTTDSPSCASCPRNRPWSVVLVALRDQACVLERLLQGTQGMETKSATLIARNDHNRDPRARQDRPHCVTQFPHLRLSIHPDSTVKFDRGRNPVLTKTLRKHRFGAVRERDPCAEDESGGVVHALVEEELHGRNVTLADQPGRPALAAADLVAPPECRGPARVPAGPRGNPRGRGDALVPADPRKPSGPRKRSGSRGNHADAGTEQLARALARGPPT
jgi:hypothetical protein